MELTMMRMPALTNMSVCTMAAAAAAAACFMVVRKPKTPARQMEQPQPINACRKAAQARQQNSQVSNTHES